MPSAYKVTEAVARALTEAKGVAEEVGLGVVEIIDAEPNVIGLAFEDGTRFFVTIEEV